MFTIKFMNFYDGGHVEHCIRCPHYQARKVDEIGWFITVYPDNFADNGVEWRVSQEQDEKAPISFAVCYVENEEGKTIAHYSSRK